MVALAGLVFAGVAIALPSESKPVRVTLSDFKIRMSRSVVAPGRVVFKVKDTGAVNHDLVFAGGKRTRILQPGRSQTIAVTFPKPGLYRFYCSVPGHAALGMKGVLRVGAGKTEKPQPPPTTTAAPSGDSDQLRLSLVASGLSAPTDVVAPPGDTSRLMIVQRAGVVSLVKDGELQQEPFLDLHDAVRDEGEMGLLSIAFAPDYAASGLLYAFYNDLAANVRVVEFQRSSSNPDTASPDGREVLRIPKPTGNHNGGMMQFGPDGYLYIAVGDGGAEPGIPIGAYGQTLDDLLGSILRIDPRGGDTYAIPADNPFASSPDARPEIVAYGLRNPWRFWIDAKTNAMLIGDVGEAAREEIDRLPLDHLGLDFGWPCREGSSTPAETPKGCDTATLTPPLWEYDHSSNRCSIIGGVTVRDPRLRDLNGWYLWSDLCNGAISALDPSARPVAEQRLGLSVFQPLSFGTDAADRVYVATGEGDVYRLDPLSSPTDQPAGMPPAASSGHGFGRSLR